ncbi:MAG: GGDEF domain-containing protein [Lachnospiraceae bacterium]|nr:GGDEF domain-containing protein [Lachnospiraceae bacterium]
MKKKIAVFSTGWGSNILVQCLQGAKKIFEANETDLYLFLTFAALHESQDITEGELNIFRLPDLHDFDGVIICANLIDFKYEIDKIVSRAQAAGIPVVSIGSVVKDTYSVISDNYSGMRCLAEHLINEHNIKKIYVIGGNKDNEGAEDRIRALKDVMKEHGLSLPDSNIFYTDWFITTAAHKTREWCRNDDLPEAIVCANDSLALTACVTLKDCGKEIPRDVAVTGFDNSPDARIFFPSLTTVDQNFMHCGEEAAKILLSHLAGKEIEPVTVVESELIVRESCGCPEDTGSVILRQQAAANAYSKQMNDTMQTRYDRKIERLILSCESISEIKKKFAQALIENHDYEGDNFHILMDESAYRSVSDVSVSMRRIGYDEELSVFFSICDGKILDNTKFPSAKLLPLPEDDKSHLYIFTPLHFNQYSAGYIVFVDSIKELEEKTLRSYYQGFNYSMEKFRQNMYLKYMNERITELAQIDSLTHIKNRAAYENKRKELQNNIDIVPGYEFGIVMFDANDLKGINDAYGHEAGDEYLKNCCALICRVFSHSPVYRIGGDEFLAVLEGNDYVNRDSLFNKFQQDMDAIYKKATAPEGKVSIACGMCIFDRTNHKSVDDIRNAADERMYENKKLMKSAAHSK